MTGVGDDLNDAIYDRIATLNLGIELLYRGDQAESDDYILFEDDEEETSSEYSDKDGDTNAETVTLVFYGTDPRALARRAKSVIDSFTQSAISVTGFYHIQTRLEMNQRRPAYTTEGQANQHSRVVRLGFILHPSP